MRIMFDTNRVEEFVSIDVISGWESGKDVEKDIPSIYRVSMETVTSNGIDYDYVGEYKLDGTKGTYKKAVKNFEEICEQLLTKGYVRESQFINFVWY